jgi:hypothetical protein
MLMYSIQLVFANTIQPFFQGSAPAAANVMLHEPTWFNWAAEVDKAHSLSPVTPSISTTLILINPIPSDATVDPVHVMFANPMPRSSTTTPICAPQPHLHQPNMHMCLTH